MFMFISVYFCLFLFISVYFCLKPKVEPAEGELFKEGYKLVTSKSRYSCSRDNINFLLTEPVVPKSSKIANIKLL